MALRKADIQSLYENLTEALPFKVKDSILQKTGRAGQSAVRDYVQACCLMTEFFKAGGNAENITDKQQLWQQLHPATAFRLKYYTPMLAARLDDLKPDQQSKLFTDPNVRFTKKCNGVRMWLIAYKGRLFAYSRNYSDVDCALLEYSANIDQHVNNDDIFAIDVECVFEPGIDIRPDLEELGLETSSPLEAMVAMLHTHAEDAIRIQQKFKAKYGKPIVAFYLIAPLYFKGKNYLSRTLGAGMEVIDDAIVYSNQIGLNVHQIPYCEGTPEEKTVFLNSLINSGCEGVVCHFKNSLYITSENRARNGYVKIKRTVGGEGSTGLDDTIDGFVTGFKVGSNGTANEGLISALQFSILVQQDNGSMTEHIIAYCPNIDKATQQLLTMHNADGLYPQEVVLSDGSTHWISMNPEFDHLVSELAGQALSAKSIRLEHPRQIRWRVEKSWNECIYTRAWLNSQTTNHVDGINY